MIARDDGTLAVNAEVSIINEKFNHLFIFATFVILVNKNYKRSIHQPLHFGLKHHLL